MTSGDVLSNWREQLAASKLGSASAAALADRPERMDEDPAADLPWSRALVDSLVARQALIAQLQAQQTTDLVTLSRSYAGQREFLPNEIGAALGISDGSATWRLHAATDLVDHLPGTLRALDSGRITADKAETIRDHTKNLHWDIRLLVEAEVLPTAGEHTVAELRTDLRRAILRRDPIGAEERRTKAKRQRAVRFWSLPDEMRAMYLVSDAVDVARIEAFLNHLADQAKTPDDERSADARRVDALVDLCSEGLNPVEADQMATTPSGEQTPAPRRRRDKVQVTIPFDVLQGVHGVCDLAGYGPIGASHATEFLGDAELIRMVTDPQTGQRLDYGRTRYLPPAWLRTFAQQRDRTCRVPGCHRSASNLETDHIVPFSQGGATSAANLGGLCKHHHRAKDGGGFVLSGSADGTLTWTTALGRRRSSPPPRLHDLPSQPAVIAGGPLAPGTTRPNPDRPPF